MIYSETSSLTRPKRTAKKTTVPMTAPTRTAANSEGVMSALFCRHAVSSVPQHASYGVMMEVL